MSLVRWPQGQEVDLLRLLASEPHGNMNHEDERLEPFCDDNSTLTNPDTFNRCEDLGWTRSLHNHDTSNSVVELTAEGREALDAVGADDWRPIDTEPRDGSPIWLGELLGGKPIHIARGRSNGLPTTWPTHWRPRASRGDG